MSALLNSERINLRKMTINDVSENYLQWMNDKEITRYLESRFQTYSLNDLTSYVKQLESDQQNILFGIFLQETAKHIGNIKLGPINKQHAFAEIGIIIGEKDCWGQGYATEAIKLLSEYAFSEIKLNKLMAGCYSLNKGSQVAFERAGFIVEGMYKQQYLVEGQYIDAIRLGLLNNKRGRLHD